MFKGNYKIPKNDKLYVKWGWKLNRSMRMEHSKNFCGLFVVCRYVCVDVIIMNSTIVDFIRQTCLRFYLVFHRSLYMSINYFALLKWLSIQHRLLLLSLHVIKLVLFTICSLAKFTLTKLV